MGEKIESTTRINWKEKNRKKQINILGKKKKKKKKKQK